MDVDLLRPGTVPISPDTILWFEFLLDQSLLLNHLEKRKPDPSPTELIIKFTTAVLESVKNDIQRIDVEQSEINIENINELRPQDTLKNLALKILSLKVAAHMKWNLDTIESKLPLKLQICLLQDLFYFTKEKIEIPNVPECTDISECSDQYLFALIFYHRWVLRMAMRNFYSKIIKSTGEIILGTIDDFFLCTPELIMNSVNFLNMVLTPNRFPKVITFHTFKMLTEDTTKINHDWEKSKGINPLEYEAQINYDLGCFYFSREEHEMSKQHFFKCSESFYSITSDAVLEYLSFDMKFLHGYLRACNIPMDDFVPNLLQQMNTAISDQYTGILSILQKDNIVREIPVVYRTVLELDIQGALSSGKFTVARDLLMQVQMLNVIRNVVDGSTCFSADFIHRIRYGGEKALDILFWAASSVVDCENNDDREKIKLFFMKILMSEDIPELLEKITLNEKLKTLLNEHDLDSISHAQIKIDDIHIPDSLKNDDWLHPDLTIRRNPYLETRILEQKLIATYDQQMIKDLLIHLSTANPNKQLLRINSNWELAIPLQSIVVSLPRGLHQDFSYVMLAKAKELMNVNDFEKSQELLTLLEAEIKSLPNFSPSVAYKFCKLISWEALLVQIMQLFVEWPATNINKQALGAKCQACLSTLESGDTVIPRLEVIEQCALCLLNLGEWDYLCGMEKRWNYFEMAAAIAFACRDLVKYKAQKKVSRDMWDLVLPIFGPNLTQAKRSSSGNTTLMHRDSPNSNNKTNLILFLSCLRDITAVSAVISMFARIYNILKDESNLELNVEYIILWPAVISNANSYNVKAVFEILSQLVTLGLKYYPNNTSWIKLMGDINFGNGHYEASLRYYIESLVISTDSFNQMTIKGNLDDHVYKRMVKCCTQINCHTQAAILCQFLDDIDYSLAFKCLSDAKNNLCYDAVDAYYNCIWDTTLLEYLVHLHHKRGEHHRKQQAVKAIGILELNSNNNEEIQREAMNIRKSRFLRALAKQYLSRNI